MFKPLYSTKARGMRVIDNQGPDSRTLGEIRDFGADNPMMYIQQQVDLPGRDFGMVFLGGEYLGAYARVAGPEAWNTTTQSGGKYACHEPPPSTVELATRAQALFGMDFTTVDVADTRQGPWCLKSRRSVDFEVPGREWEWTPQQLMPTTSCGNCRDDEQCRDRGQTDKGRGPGGRLSRAGSGRHVLAVRSNSAELLQLLRRYFAHAAGTGPADVEILAVEGEQVDLGLPFTDWKREPGKSGRKDAYHDLVDGRLIQKVRTGMVFLQNAAHRIACGPCQENSSQLINFINTQFSNWLQRRGALICHAAGLVRGEDGLGIAGFSGGGKSTLMLRLLDDPATAYLTNDRLFMQTVAGGVRAVGIPKLPRVNPAPS